MRFKRAGFLTKIVVLALLIYMATSLLDLRGQIQAAQDQRDILAQQVADQRLTNQDLADAIEHSDDPEMLEQVAHLLGETAQTDELEDVDIAFYGEYRELTAEQKEAIRQMVRLMRQKG